MKTGEEDPATETTEKAKTEIFKVCPSNHVLEDRIDIHIGACDNCHSDIEHDVSAMSCDLCNYSLCQNCAVL